MNDQWTERLSEYLDGDLDAVETRAVEAHLAQCARCRAVLDDLRRITVRARALDDRPPEADLWPRIAQSIGLDKVRRLRSRVTFSVPQLLAASVALVLVSAGGAWLTLRETHAVTATPAQVSPVAAITATSWSTNPKYATAVSELEAALEEGRRTGRLDSSTVRVVTHNLAIVDSAIAQARRALDADPGSAYLNHHLAETMQRKVDLLRSATALVART